MDKVKLGLMTNDTEYAERLMTYVRTSPYRERIVPVWYADEAGFLERVKESGSPDILLADAPFAEAWAAGIPDAGGCRLIRLWEGEEDGQAEDSADKYQPLNRLMDHVLWLAGEINNKRNRVAIHAKRCSILCVYSAVGGAGKTVFVQVAAGILARMGYRPVLVSLESVPSPCYQVDSMKDAFGRVMYYAGAARSSDAVNVVKYLCEDPVRRIRMLPAAPFVEELVQMEEGDAAKLLQAMAASECGDVVIVEADSSLHPRVRGALSASDRIICLVPDDRISVSKTEQTLRRLGAAESSDLTGKMTILMNRCRQPPAADPAGLGDLVEDALPLQPEWLHLLTTDILQERSLYHDRVQSVLTRLLREISGSRKGRASVEA